MTTAEKKRISKKMSLVLRHRPEVMNLSLDEEGWCEVTALLAAFRRDGKNLSRGQLEEVVATNDKKRFAFSDDGLRIRANQGHSISVQLGYEASIPPDLLFHGTATRNLESIREKGLLKGQRHQVHLSAEKTTALQVGGRHGKPVVLQVKAGQMHAEGFVFHRSENGVWLTETVPPQYLQFPV